MPGILGNAGSVDLSAIEADIAQLETDVAAAQEDATDALADAATALAAATAAKANIGEVTFNTSSLALTNMAAGEAELVDLILGTGRYRRKLDLTNAVDVTLSLNIQVAGANGSVIRPKYSTDGGSNWSALCAAAACDVPLQNTGLVTLTAAVVAGAKGVVLVTLFSQGGDASADPAFGAMTLQFHE